MLKTIGVGGQLSSGKDTVVDYLVKRLNEISKEKWIKNAFANKVKEVFVNSFGKSREWIEEWKRKEMAPPGFKKNVRQCLIGIGDGFRLMNPTIWMDHVFQSQQEHQIISDCRYVNECNRIRETGGITVLLWREGHMNSIQNASEQDLMPFIKKCIETQSWTTGDLRWKPFEGEIGPDLEMPFDLFIRNDGTIEDLEKKIDKILVPFVKKKWADMF